MYQDEAEYLSNWIWPSHKEGYRFYCRTDHRWYVTWEEAVAAVRKKDAEDGVVWPWSPLFSGKE